MTYPTELVVQGLLEAVRREDKLASFEAVLRPFFREKTGYKDDEAMLLLIATVADAGSTLNRTRRGIIETRYRKGRPLEVVSEETLGRAIRAFGRNKGE